jgi:hypothetical protein
MKLLGWFIVGLLAGPAAVYAAEPESQHDKDVRECRKEGDAAVASAKLKHPLEVAKVKADAENKCLRARGYATGKIREK